MANFSHFTRGSCVSITQHNERKKNEKGEYLKYKNQQIDTNRTHLNYNLASKRDPLQFIKERTEELKCLNRKDVNVLASWIVTVPKEVPEKYQREFFERTYKFLSEKYGEKNVVAAYVHNDENQPHIHFTFVPVVYDHKKKREKVSCKECVTKFDLQKFHPDFQKEINIWKEKQGYTFECDILNGATVNGNMTVEQLKAHTLAEQNKEEQAILNELVEQNNEECVLYQEVQRDIQMLSEERKMLTEGVFDLKADISTLKDEKLILEDKIDVLKGNCLTLMQKFIELPQIKPIYDKFCKTILDRLEEQKIERAEKKNTGERKSLDYYKEQIAKIRQSSPTVEKNISKNKINRESR